MMLDLGLGLGFNYGALPAAIQRHITSLNAAGGMYYELSEPVVIGAGEDFEIEVPFATSSSDTQVLLGTDLTTSFIFINGSDNWLAVRDLDNVQKQTGNNAFEDASVCILSIKRVSNLLTISTPNGTWTDSSVTGGFEFKYVGQRGSGATYNFTGELYDVKIWTGGDRNTGTLLHIPIDEGWKTSTDLHDAEGNIIGSAINITEDDAEQFTKVDDGANWLGSVEYVTSAQTWEWDGTESDYAFKALRTEQTVYLFREALDLTGGVSGGLKIQSSASGASAFKNAGDVYIRDISHGTSNTLLQTSSGTAKYVGESKASLKRLIPISGGA